MKTVPYLYSDLKERPKINNEQAATNGKVAKETASQQPAFLDLIIQNSPFRFMKIHTSLMEKEGIYKNDIAVIDPAQIPVNGKIIVANIDDTLMIRRYEKVKNGFVLHVDDQKISPLKIEPGYDKVEIIGVVTFIIKSV